MFSIVHDVSINDHFIYVPNFCLFYFTLTSNEALIFIEIVYFASNKVRTIAIDVFVKFI